MLAEKKPLEPLYTRKDLADFVRDFNNNDTGFMFCPDSRIDELNELLDSDGHSGASFACCLRKCQKLLREQQKTQSQQLEKQSEQQSEQQPAKWLGIW